LSYFDIVYGLYLVIDIAKKKKPIQMIITSAAQVNLNVTFTQFTQLALLPDEMKYLSQYLKINNSYVYIQLSNLFLSLTI